MSRIRVAVLASASTLALVVATKIPGVVAGITAGSAVLAAVAAAWPSATDGNEKKGHHTHEVTKKVLGFYKEEEKSGLHCGSTAIKKNSLRKLEADTFLASS